MGEPSDCLSVLFVLFLVVCLKSCLPGFWNNFTLPNLGKFNKLSVLVLSLLH